MVSVTNMRYDLRVFQLIGISLNILVTEQIIPQQIVPELYITFQMSFQSDGSYHLNILIFNVTEHRTSLSLMQNIK